MTVRSALLLLAAGSALAVGPRALAAAFTNTSSTWVPIAIEGQPICNDDDVVIAGNVHLVSTTTTRPDGSSMTSFHVEFADVTAIGVTSGNVYRVIEADSYVTDDSSATTGTVVINGHLIGAGQTPNTNVQLLAKFTITPDGTLTANVDSFTLTCR
jgi:hypothetical protein